MNNKEEKKEITQEQYEEYQTLKAMFKNIEEGISRINKGLDQPEEK